MADPEALLSTIEAQLNDHVAEVKRLQQRYEQKQEAWEKASGDIRKEEKGWEAAERLLKAAQEKEAALRGDTRMLLKQLAPPSEV